jgi:uncharacterized protein
MRFATGALATLLVGIIRLYRLTLVGLLGGQCRFEPSCSRYGEQAIQQYGPYRGGLMTLKRLGSCHPWHPGGLDPVK